MKERKKIFIWQVTNITIILNDHLQTKTDIAMLYQVQVELLQSINFSIKQIKRQRIHTYFYKIHTFDDIETILLENRLK